MDARIETLGMGFSTVAYQLRLNSSTDNVRITGGGLGTTTLEGGIVEGATPRPWSSRPPQTRWVPGLVRLVGSASFTGGVTLQSGNLELTFSGALGTGALTIQGGLLSVAGGAVSNSVQLQSDLLINGGGTISSGITTPSSATPPPMPSSKASRGTSCSSCR